MTSTPIVAHFRSLKQLSTHCWWLVTRRHLPLRRPDLHHLALNPADLPSFVRQSSIAMRYLRLLGPLAWQRFPERDLETEWGIPTLPYAPFVAACLIKLDQQLAYMSNLRQYLVDHPALTWVLGFPLAPSSAYPWGFDVDASLPTQRHFTRMLRRIPNASLQFLLDETVRLLQAELHTEVDDFGQAISLDTKHILAWVKENNPKAYIKESERFDKNRQPNGDPDCRLGCKRRRNQRASSKEPPPTPPDNPVPANTVSVGEYYWGYASGVVATKVPGWGEFVLAELTQPFDRSDVSYFFPLMADVERRLGFRPKFGAFDAAFDAFYVYEYFHQEGEAGFAAVPFAQRGGHKKSFDAEGRPLCQAGLAMPLKHTFWSKTTLVPHERGRYACPLLFPEGADLPHPSQAVAQGRLYHHAAHQHRSPYPLSDRPRQRSLQRSLQATHGQRAHQLPGGGVRHRAPQVAQRGGHCQPEHPDLRTDQPTCPAAGTPEESGARCGMKPVPIHRWLEWRCPRLPVSVTGLRLQAGPGE